MNRMGETRDMFEGLGCDDEITNLGEPHVPFNPSPERERDERSDIERFRDDYVITPFSQSTQAWRMRAEEDRRRCAAKFEIDAVEKDLTKSVGGDPNDVVDLSADIWLKPGDVDDNSIDIEDVKVAGESSRTLSFRKKRRGLSPHRLPLKERMKDRTISYVDLLRPNPPPPRFDTRRKPQSSTRLP
jgi:hypothetical protein